MLKLIYILFLGVIIATFIGVGISAFYEAPAAPKFPETLNLVPKEGPTEAQQAQQQTFDVQQQAYNAKMNTYNRNVSIIALGFAVLLLVLSLVFADKIGIIANGLLLGGLFTLLYSLGRGLASGSSKYRFLIMGIGLLIALALGYQKFIKPAESAKKLTKN